MLDGNDAADSAAEFEVTLGGGGQSFRVAISGFSGSSPTGSFRLTVTPAGGAAGFYPLLSVIAPADDASAAMQLSVQWPASNAVYNGVLRF